MAGTCRYCSCTDEEACDGGCSWADESRSICSTCAVTLDIAKHLVTVFGAVVASPKAKLQTSVEARWEALTDEQQKVLVFSCRGVMEAIRDGLRAGLDDDALANRQEIETIADFLLEHADACDNGTDESISAIVIRLLTPHVGSRIVLAGGGL